MKIKYADYKYATKKSKLSFENLYTSITLLIQALRAVNACGFVSGNAAEQWVDYTDRVSKMQNILKGISEKIDSINEDFLNELDEDQKYNGVSIMYDIDYPGLRDYSSKHFYDLKNYVEDTNYDSDLLSSIANGFENFGYSVANGWSKLWGKTGYDNSKTKNIKNTQQVLLQWKDITKERLKTIEININYTDSSISNRVSNLNQLVIELYEYVEKLIEPLVNSKLDNFTIEPYIEGIDSSFRDVVSQYNIFIDDCDITDEDVEDFLSDPHSEKFLEEQVEVINKYLSSELNFTDFNEIVKLWIFQMFNIAEGTVLGKGDYEKYLAKAELIELFDELADTEYYYPESYEKEQLKLATEFFSKLNEYGGDVYEFLNSHRYSNGKLILDGRTVEAKQFKEFFDKFGKASEILKYGDKGIDVLSKLFVNYQKNLSFLDSIERNCELTGNMKEVFNELRDLYEKDLNGVINTSIDTILDVGIDAAYSCSVGSVIGALKESVGFVGDITGYNEITLAQYQLMAYGREELNMAQTSFNNSYEALKSCDKDSANYDVYMNDFKNSFSTYKVVLKRMFEKLASASTGKWKSYYEYCSTQTAKINLNNFDEIDILSYDEWLKI